jgi:hypothetical protein
VSEEGAHYANATCAMITAEIQANNIKVQELAGEEGAKVAQNVAAGVAGVVIPVLWFGMDFKGAGRASRGRGRHGNEGPGGATAGDDRK